ncbi:MAG TPA: hypothetical protein VGO00_00055, partial [Kofleriaceae bacterium]|nr:hypothetical protein [Kofleriaceae bacterium]
RDHRIRIYDMAKDRGRHPSDIAGDFTFRIRGGNLVEQYEKGVTQRYAAGAGQSVGILKDQINHTDILNEQLQAESALVVSAGNAIVQSDKEGAPEVAAALLALNKDMTNIDLMLEVDGERVERAKTNATTIVTWLRRWTNNAGRGNEYTYTNTNTGEQYTKERGASAHVTMVSYAARLVNALDAHQFKLAVTNYDLVANGVFDYAHDQLAFKSGMAAAAQFKSMQEMRDNIREIGTHDTAFRVPATFTADDSYSHEAEFGTYRVVPMQLYVWREGTTWYLRDFTNSSSKAWKAKADASEYEGDRPPVGLFSQLNHPRAYPKGVIRYFLPKGHDGNNTDKDSPAGHGDQVICDEHKSWADHIQDIALALAVIGMIAATGGLGLVAFAAFAASAVIGTVGSIAEIADAYEHGYADNKLVFVNVVNIVANLATLGTLSAGRAITTAAQAVRAGTEIKGAAASALRFAKGAYMTMAALNVTANATNVVIMAEDLVTALDEIDRNVPASKRSIAKAKILAQFAIMGGLQIMAVHGDLPALAGHSPIVIDTLNGVRIVRASGVEVGGHEIDLSKASRDTHAAARWESRELEDTLRREPTSPRGRAAKVILGESKYKKPFEDWMKQASKVGADGKVIPPKGAAPELIGELQRLVDGGNIATYERAFAVADKIRDAGKGIDLDVHAKTWPESRSKLIEVLGNDDHAHQLVATFERIQLGANASDLSSFMAQRAAITRVVPEAELDAIRKFYPEGQVYLTGDLARPGARVDASRRIIEIVVVAPKDTSAELLGAMEQRLSNHDVHPERAFLERSGFPADTTFQVRVKVVTSEQFAGLVTTPGTGSFHKIDSTMPDMIGGKVRPVRDGVYAADAGDMRASHASWKERGGTEKVSPLHYDPATSSAHFDVELGRGGQKIRVTAQVAPRITNGADLATVTNRVVGTKMLGSADAAHAILREVNQGKLHALEQLGIKVPEGLAVPEGTEFGVGKTTSGYVIVRGNLREVDWEHLPGIEPVAHTHPDIPANDLPEPDLKSHPERRDPVTGQIRYSMYDLAQTTEPFFARDLVFASAPDIGLMARLKIGEHRVITGFVYKQGYVMKPMAGDTSPRLEFVIKDAKQIGRVDKSTVYETEIIGEVEGKPVVRKTVYAVQAPDGTGHLEVIEPANMVRDVVEPPRATTAETMLPPGKTVSDVRLGFEAKMKPELEKLAQRPVLVVMPANEFASKYGTDHGRAVFFFERGEAVIYARPDATEIDLRDEITHVKQLESPTMGAEIRKLYGQLVQDKWPRSSARDRMELFRRKLVIEIDSQQRQLAELNAARSADAKAVAETLANLRGLQQETEAITELQLSQMSAGELPLPDYLQDPAYLFSKAPKVRGGKVDRNAVDIKTSTVELPRTGNARSAAYETRDNVVAVNRRGKEWTEYTAVSADEGGTVSVSGNKITVEADDGTRHVYEVDAGATMKVGTGQKINRGKLLAEESDRRYRLVEIHYGDGTTDMREEIQRADGDGWVQRGSESTRRGSIAEIAAKAQVEAELARTRKTRGDAGKFYNSTHIKHQRLGGGFDDV